MNKNSIMLCIVVLLTGCSSESNNGQELFELCKGEPRTFSYEQGAFMWGWKIIVTCTEPAHE